VAWPRWHPLAQSHAQHGCGLHALRAGPASLSPAAQRAALRARQNLAHAHAPFLVLGTLTTLYILRALCAYPTQVFVRGNSIVYLNAATNNTVVAVLYVIATCGSLLFSKIKDMVIFGIANVAILLVVMAFKSYAFTSLWCAYAAIASVVILAYFWKSHATRPFRYAEAI
jgi:hypothetical protein